MYPRKITYTNFDDEVVTETYYFNLSKPELLEFKVDFDGGVEKILTKIIEEQDEKGMLEWFKKFILMGYGVREGDRFIKSDELSEQFSQTAAYEQLYTELMTDDNLAADFLIGMLPKDLTSKIDKGELFKRLTQDVNAPVLNEGDKPVSQPVVESPPATT